MNPVFCRMCLKDPPADSLVFSIYDTVQGRPLVELIDELFSIKVNVEDRLLNVCLECVNKINSVQKICRLFVANNDKLQSMLHGEEAEAIGIDNETENAGYEVMHSAETSANAQGHKVLWKTERETPHRPINGEAETEEELLTVEEPNTVAIEELFLDSDVKCGIARPDLEVNDESSTDDQANRARQLAELNRKCYFCGVIFSTSLEYINHLTQHYDRVPYTCTECNGLVVHSVQFASRHIGMHDRTDRPYGCRVCALRFTSKDRSLGHERKAHRYKPKQQQLSVSRIPSSRSTSIDSNRAVRSMRNQLKPRPFNCQICGNSFTLKRNLNRHMRIHAGQKPYKCIECDKTFLQSSDLAVHLRRHRPNVTSECSQNKKKESEQPEK
ncbi:zinc finger protein 572-like [Anopheles aquasalis]|uniref:zinc finger protein 572-like n=1 Tax=Anopheles aquasalis TaxID=42839 RepID=UPI00215A25B1|nr:zinc finger protein 572-like [Anopheles aquasalis]